ncbi:hypothetical protein NpPPO83_00009437 [Neofusicoccum parvum]|uniref:Uncharacterized protein n=1 Tax=Neofusicoccum parvum TaxID=310453 RepID=A0ACB5SPV9_9PEZI|nr:hypothetical protein NpPPO83_00009437 [Neofusicoccum parvum]
MLYTGPTWFLAAIAMGFIAVLLQASWPLDFDADMDYDPRDGPERPAPRRAPSHADPSRTASAHPVAPRAAASAPPPHMEEPAGYVADEEDNGDY